MLTFLDCVKFYTYSMSAQTLPLRQKMRNLKYFQGNYQTNSLFKADFFGKLSVLVVENITKPLINSSFNPGRPDGTIYPVPTKI